MQLGFEVRPLGFPRRIGRDEVVALLLRFDGETLRTIREARGSVEITIRGCQGMSDALHLSRFADLLHLAGRTVQVFSS